MSYTQGLRDAAKIAEAHAKADGIAANQAATLSARLECKAQQERALSIELEILRLMQISEEKKL